MASNDETVDHLAILYETKSLTNVQVYHDLHKKLEILGRKLNNFLKAVEKGHNKPYQVNDPETDYGYIASSIQYPESSIQNPAS